MITIINYGMGNLGSIANMINKIGYQSLITNEHKKIKKATKLILPGVGSFDKAMKNLQNLELISVIKEKVINDKTPLLGICLGMQLLTQNSEEGNEQGLGFIDGQSIRFKFNDRTLKIPHMGWNLVEQKKEHQLFRNMPEEPRFYFVHSFYITCNNSNDVLTTTNYGIDFVSSFAYENILGVQFHPEKSHKYGMKLMQNFIENF